MSGLQRARARRTARAGEPPLARALGATALALGGGASLAGAALQARGRSRPAPAAAEREISGLYAAAALLALSVLVDSAVEHYRGEYRNPGMYAPLVASAAALAVTADGVRRPERSR